MEDSTRLAAAVVAAAVILVGGYVAYSEYARSRDIDEAQQAFASLQQQRHDAVQASQRLTSLSQQRDPRMPVDAIEVQRERRRLAVNQRCVGGTVVQVNGSTYTQVLAGGVPVHCVASDMDR